MEPWIALLGLVSLGAAACMLAAARRRRNRAVVLRIDIGHDAGMPLTVVNAGREAVLELEATLRFDPREPRDGHVLERHRRTRVLLPGQRLAFPLPQGTSVEEAGQFASLARRVHLDAVGRDAAGRRVTARDVLEDPIGWIGSVHLSDGAATASDTTPERPVRTSAP